MATQMSKKRKFCADGVFKAELNEMLMRELAEDGYVPATPTCLPPTRISAAQSSTLLRKNTSLRLVCWIVAAFPVSGNGF